MFFLKTCYDGGAPNFFWGVFFSLTTFEELYPTSSIIVQHPNPDLDNK